MSRFPDLAACIYTIRYLTELSLTSSPTPADRRSQAAPARCSYLAMRLHSQRPHLHPRILALTLLALLLVLLLPYDSALVLLVRWHLNALSPAFAARDDYRHTPPRFPLHITDVGIIVKTGFSTQDRLVARLAAFEPGRDPTNLVLVGDYSTEPGRHFEHRGLQMPVYDALEGVVASAALLSKAAGAERLGYYRNLTAAIASGDWDLARGIGTVYGWEMDIMKVSIFGLDWYRSCYPLSYALGINFLGLVIPILISVMISLCFSGCILTMQSSSPRCPWQILLTAI